MDFVSPLSLDKPLLELIRNLLHEIQPQKRFGLTLQSRLDRDLGFDSLSRAELLMRIEQTFRTRLPEQTLSEAETIGDLLDALGNAKTGFRVEARSAPRDELLPSVGAPDTATTLVEALDWHAARHPKRPHLTYLQDGSEPVTLTYGELARAAREVAAGLLARNINRGDRVALMLPTGTDFFVCFFGILYAGAVPVRIYPPARLSQLEEHVHRQSGILRNCGVRLLITTERGKTLAASIKPHVPTMEDTVSAADLTSARPRGKLWEADARETALLQYTSGSTGDPKGVILSHANLLANIRAMGEAMRGEFERRLRQLASLVPRYGADRRLAGLALFRLASHHHVTADISGASGNLALGDPSLSGHAVGGTQLCFRDVCQQDLG